MTSLLMLNGESFCQKDFFSFSRATAALSLSISFENLQFFLYNGVGILVKRERTIVLSSGILATTGMSVDSSISLRVSSYLGSRILFIIIPAIGLPLCFASLAAFNVQDNVG